MPVHLTIEDMQQLAASHDGKCLSTKYKDVRTKLEWQCANGHKWEAPPVNVQKGHWCGQCANQARRLTIEKMQELASAHQGRCLSKNYENTKTKLQWECREGHRWWAIPASIIRGSWCRECSRAKTPTPAKSYKDHPKKHTIEKMRELARSRGGKCWSSRYKDVFTPLEWECAVGHRFTSSPRVVMRGSWCTHCAGTARHTIEEMHVLAAERGGVLLSTSYKGANTPLRWLCEDGHEFRKRPSEIMNAGGWCPDCSQFLRERLCREILTSIFNKPFPKKKPKWLVNKRGNRMELDGYCSELKLAFEYHGIQHYEEHPHFHSREATFEQRTQDDENKRALCKDRGVTLIEIPFQLSDDEVVQFIKKNCIQAGFDVPKEWSKQEIDIGKAYSPRRLRELQEIAAKRGGKCLSKKYVSIFSKMSWQCAEGHTWRAAPANIKRGSWCHRCSGQGGYTLEDAKATAAARGGKCLSKRYVDASTTALLWECENGHKWHKTYTWIRRGVWCPECRGSKKYTLDYMRILAEKKGGRCLSNSYQSVKTAMLWECRKGHRWRSSPTVILRGGWCRKCDTVARRHSISEMQELAKKHKGKCLSTEYMNLRTPLKWECARGHKFETIPHLIFRGHWCPDCGGSKKLTINLMRQIAEEKGGQCLSVEYRNIQTPLTWKCAEGHTWDTRPANVIYSDTWCPECAKLKRIKRA